MKKYYIQSRVCTGTEILSKYTHDESKLLIERFELTFEYEGFHFEQWDFTPAEGALGDAWVVKNTINAQSIEEAINKHLRQLDKTLPKLFFGVPVWHSFGVQEPLLISLDSDFREGFFFLRKEREGVGLTITDEILAVIRGNCFQNIPDNFFLWYSEFINSKDSLSALSLGLTALEIIRPHENKDKELVLGKNLYEKIYLTTKKSSDKREGIRHRIHHGRYPMEGDDIISDQNEMHNAIYKCLLHINPEIQKVYDMRSQFVGIPRQKVVIEGYEDGIFLISENQKPIKLNELNKYVDLDFYTFQHNIKSMGIEIDITRKLSNY